MKDKLKQIFDKTLCIKGHYLLGLSGGSDSMGLFYALLNQKISFEVCTVDHQSRSAIASEVEFIGKLCQKHGVVFHLKRVEGISPRGANLEDRYRQARYALLEEVYCQGKFDALLLGHHADDQVETILKRFFEGGHIRTLGGISQITTMGKMQVIRPFLEATKQEIVNWLESIGVSWFEDETNQDGRYLRARMRGEMLPLLKEKFGKEITKNILSFGAKMRLLEEYFHQTDLRKVEGPFGSFYPIDVLMRRIEADFFLRAVCEQEGLNPSREEIDRMSLAIEKKELGIEMQRGVKRLILDHHGVFVVHEKETDYILEKGEVGDEGWQGVIKGKVVFTAPPENFELRVPELLTQRLLGKVSLKKWYALHKVPVFLRERIPVIFNKDQLIGECLTGRDQGAGGIKWVLTFITKENRMEAPTTK